MIDELTEFTGRNARDIADQIKAEEAKAVEASERAHFERNDDEMSSAEITAELQAEDNPQPVAFPKTAKAFGNIVDELTYINYKHNRTISPKVTPEDWEVCYPKGTVPVMEAKLQAEKNTTITDVELDGVDTGDYPDFVDAFVVSCLIDGRKATEEELDSINDDSGLRYGLVSRELFGEI